MKKRRPAEPELQAIDKRIADSWGENVAIRAKDLEQETDRTYIDVIKPWVIKRINECMSDDISVLDIGCGCGYLTNAVYRAGFPKIKGVDISPKAIEYARSRYSDIAFECCDICDYVSSSKYDVCLCVMTLNNMSNIERFFSSLRQLVSDTGKVLLVIPHPCFWPQRHLKDKSYSYFQEKPYEFEFATKGRTDYFSTVLYFHRTIETYHFYIHKSGFVQSNIWEFSDGNKNGNPDMLCIEICPAM